MKDTNIMKAQMKVDTILRNGIVEKVEAQEEYLYRPFSVGNQGATTSVTSKLTLKETNKGTIQSTSKLLSSQKHFYYICIKNYS